MAISPVSSVNNSIRNLSFGEKQEKTNTENKPKLSTQTKVLIGAGLTALAAVGIYIATRGRTKVKPEINVNENIQNVIKSYKERYSKVFGDIEPKITTLKNGKTKIEFLRNESEKHMLICDKNGSFEKRILFYKDSEFKNDQWYTVYKNFENGQNDILKSFSSRHFKKNVDGNDIDFAKIKINKHKDEGVFRKEILIKKTDKYICIENGIEAIPCTKHRGVCTNTHTSLKNGKPELVYQFIYHPREGIQSSYKFKPSKNIEKIPVEDSPFLKDKNYEIINLAY